MLAATWSRPLFLFLFCRDKRRVLKINSKLIGGERKKMKGGVVGGGGGGGGFTLNLC